VNAPELLYGTRAPASVALASQPLDVNARDTLIVPAVDMLYVLYEMPMRQALACLPASLHPAIPAVFAVTFIHAKDGPFGGFTFAYCGVACRTGIKPRHFVTAAFCDDDTAARVLGERYGFACVPADVRYRETYDRVQGTIAVSGAHALDVAITDCLPLVGTAGIIKYSPPLNATRVNGTAVMVQFEAAYDFKRSARGKPRLAQFDAAALGDASVRPSTPIAGSRAVCDLHLLPARFTVDIALPAERGGARKIAR